MKPLMQLQRQTQCSLAVGRPVIDRCAAICCRSGPARSIDVLLLSEDNGRRWVIPSGRIENNEKPYYGALKEAFEEAGVWGKIRKRALGRYTYAQDHLGVHVVSVHLLRVETETHAFPGATGVKKVWIKAGDAARLVHEPSLEALLHLIDEKSPLNSQDRRSDRKHTLLGPRPSIRDGHWAPGHHVSNSRQARYPNGRQIGAGNGAAQSVFSDGKSS